MWLSRLPSSGTCQRVVWHTDAVHRTRGDSCACAKFLGARPVAVPHPETIRRVHSLTTLYSKYLMFSVWVYSSSRAVCRCSQWQSLIPIPLYSHQYHAPHQTRLYPTGIIACSVDCTNILKKLGVSIFKDEETPEVGSSKFIRERCTFYQTTRRRIPQQS